MTILVSECGKRQKSHRLLNDLYKKLTWRIRSNAKDANDTTVKLTGPRVAY